MAIETKVAGVTYRNDDGSSRQKIIASLSPDDRLVIRSGVNQEHPHALSVLTMRGECIGVVPASMAWAIKDEVLSLDDIQAHVLKVVGGKEGKRYGLVVSIDLPKDLSSRIEKRYNAHLAGMDIGASYDMYEKARLSPPRDLRQSDLHNAKHATKNTGSLRKWILSVAIALLFTSLIMFVIGDWAPSDASNPTFATTSTVLAIGTTLIARLLMELPAAIRMQKRR